MATRDTYTKQIWKNLPETETPISAGRLEHMEEGIEEASNNRALKEIYGDSSMKLQTYDHESITDIGEGSVVHGADSCASGNASYSGGMSLTNTGYFSHAEGSNNTINSGSDVHVEGGRNTMNGSTGSHGEGFGNTVSGGEDNHIEGRGNQINNGYEVHAEGNNNNASPASSKIYGAHVEGGGNKLRGDYTHIEGYGNEESPISGTGYNHIEGESNTLAGSQYIHMEGYRNKAGDSSQTAQNALHVEGMDNTGLGYASHVEGQDNKENPGGSFNTNHIEGGNNTLYNSNSYVHVSGYSNQSQGSSIGAVYGYNNVLYGDYQFVCGKNSNADRSKAFIVGGGQSSDDRKNILTVDWTGNIEISGDLTNGAGISLNSLKSALDTINSIAAGGSAAKVFNTKEELDTWLAVEGNPETLKVGQNIYIVETGTPDYWWDGTGLQVLETDKVEIEAMTYEETMAILDAGNGEVA